MKITSQSKQLLGTTIEIKLPDQHESLFADCFSELTRIERTYSRFLPNSELSKLNSNLGKWQSASEEMLYLLTMADGFKRRTGGHFDIAVKEVLDDLGYDSHLSFKPKKPPVVRPVSGLIGDQFVVDSVVIDSKKKHVLLNRQIDLGGIGKGFALDKISQLLSANGVKHYYINAGGDIYALQAKGEAPWVVLLEHPDDPTRAIGQVELGSGGVGGAIAGSAANRRKWNGGKLHHLINTKTGLPADGAKAIFVTASAGMEADVYATALFTAGFETGIELAGKLPVEILFISPENKVFQSAGFKVKFF